MNSIFNYQTLNVELIKETRTLFIELDQGAHNYLNMETLFELESLLAWSSGRVEINSIFISSTGEYFSHGYNKNVLSKYKLELLQKFTSKLQKINQAIMLLPQTVIIDLQMGTENIASELATACDIRIAHRACKINFNHAKLGMIPCSGGLAQLSHTIGHAHAKNWLLLNQDIPLSKLEYTGFVAFSYLQESRAQTVDMLLQDISNQSPVQRIQTKLGVVENIRSHIETMNTFEKQISKAAMATEDWKEISSELTMKAKSFKTAVKLSLVKSDSDDFTN